MFNFKHLQQCGLLILNLIPMILLGTTIQVPADFKSIQAGINTAQSGDTVLVSDGIYYENINFRGKNIVVASHYAINRDTSHITNTIIDGSQPAHPDTGSCVLLMNAEDATAVIQGFTLQNGTGTKTLGGNWIEGGGIILEYSSATIKNNMIKNCSAVSRSGTSGGGGGGISSIRGNPKILNNVIMNNTSSYACGIVLNWSDGIIKNNIIYRNYGGLQFGGGGIMVWQSPMSNIILIENNTIVCNRSYLTGGAIEINQTDVTLRNNIIWGNIQKSGNQISYISQYSKVQYNNHDEFLSDQSNLSIYPDFSESNFMLSNNSPCIDAGSPELNLNDKEDPDNSGAALFPSLGGFQNDIGAYGGNGAAVFPDFRMEGLYLSYKRFYFGTHDIGDTSSEIVHIVNMSTKSIQIDSIHFNNSKGELRINKTSKSWTYSPAQTDTLEIIWTPRTSGSITDTLKIFHSSKVISKNPLVFPIKGTAREVTGIKEEYLSDKTRDFTLHNSYPNPFNPVTTIRLQIGDPQKMTLNVYDVTGKLVTELFIGNISTGDHLFEFDARDLASGIYIIQARGEKQSQHFKALLVK